MSTSTPKPLLGAQSPDWTSGLCSYSPRPGEILCGQAATWHGIVTTLPDSDVSTPGLESCDDHLPQMKLTADFVHPFVHPCGIPGAVFREPENRCFIEWDEAAEFSNAASAAPSLAS